MIWRPEIGLYEKRHMYWENFRDLLGAADEALDYQWAVRLKQKDPIPEKSDTGKGELSLTAMSGDDEDPLELWEGTCWHYWNGQGRDGLRWQDLSKVDDAGLPAEVADALKILPDGNPKQEQSAQEWYQQDLADDADISITAVYDLPYDTYVWSAMEEGAPDVSWWTWIKYVWECFWGPTTEHRLPATPDIGKKQYVLVGFGEGGYRAQLLSMYMTLQNADNKVYDTFTFNAPGVHEKMQDEYRIFQDILPEDARPDLESGGHKSMGGHNGWPNAPVSEADGIGMPYADPEKKANLLKYLESRRHFENIYNYRHVISLGAAFDLGEKVLAKLLRRISTFFPQGLC